MSLRQVMPQDAIKAGIADGRDRRNELLNSSYAGRGLSVKLTGRLYGMRARFHIYARDYILADADSAYVLSLDPFQHEVRFDIAACLASDPCHLTCALNLSSLQRSATVNCSLPHMCCVSMHGCLSAIDKSHKQMHNNAKGIHNASLANLVCMLPVLKTVHRAGHLRWQVP